MLKNYLIFFLFVILLFSCEENNEVNGYKVYLESNKFNNLSKTEKLVKLDSLYYLTIKSNSNDFTTDELLKLSEIFYNINLNEKSREIAKISLNVSKKNNDTLNIGKSYNYIGDTYEKTVKDSAYYFYSLSSKVYLLSKMNEEYAKSQFNIAYLLFYDGNYIDCEAKLVKSLKYSENSSNFIYKYSYLTLMGNCQEKLKNYDLALKYHLKAIEVLKKIGKNDENLIYRVSSNINICNLYDIEKSYSKTINVLTKLIVEEDLQNKSQFIYANVLNNLAYAKMKNGDFNNVENDFLKALKISEEINNNNEILYRKVNLGEYYLTVGNLSKSKIYLKESLSLSKQIGNYNEYLKSLKFLAKVDTQNKDFYNDEYVRVKDSITTTQLTNREKYARIEYETSKIEEENEKLTQQNLLILLGTLFVTTLFLLIVFFLKLNSQKKENKLLSDKQKAENEMLSLIDESRKNIEKTKIFEQNRISKELHDGVLNDLYGIRLNLDYMVSSLDNELSSETEAYIESLLKVEDDIRKISHDLKIEEKFEKSEFKNIITSLIHDKNEFHKVNFECVIDDKIDWNIFTTSDKLNIYRILQEATQNVIKHSNASSCKISFENIDEEVKLIIEDNGIGLNLENNVLGIGLKNIKERVRELNGNVFFDSKNNTGTKITINIKH